MKSKTVGGVLLVAGTTIGAGMLALPLMTAAAGFIPALLLFILCWALSLYTAFITVEATLWFDEEVNLISLARKTLGRGGEVITWIVFLLFLYALCAAYITAGGALLADALAALGWKLPPLGRPLPFLILFGAIVMRGTKLVDLSNRLLMAALIVSFGLLLCWVLPQVEHTFLSRATPSALWMAVPIVTASFGFHMVLPSLTAYLKRDLKAIKRAIVWGSFIPLIAYAAWELAILGVVPPKLLEEGAAGSLPVGELLAQVVSHPWLGLCGKLFAFLAIVTSFLGVALSLKSFLKDGMSRQSTGVTIALATFLPPLVFALYFPGGFALALSYAGVFVALLEGALPACMIYRHRYIQKLPSSYRVKGGRAALLTTLLLSLIVLALQIGNNWGSTTP